MKTLLEQAEEARQAGDRARCLELKAKAEAERHAEIKTRHDARVEAAKSDFPVGKYIAGYGAVEKIEDGCGTQRGWISVVFGGGKREDVDRLRRELAKRAERAAIGRKYAALTFKKEAHASIDIPGTYEEALDGLVRYMELDRIWTMEEWQDNNIDSFYEAYDYAYKEAVNDGQTDEKAEEAGDAARDDAEGEAFEEYRGKLIDAINCALEYAGLELLEEEKGVYRLAPRETWREAAEKMAMLISGYGTFEYRSGKELKETGPYKTYCEAVMQHLHWAKHGPEVYGGRSYDYMMR